MSTPATVLLSTLPPVAGWAVHAWRMRARLNTARRDPLTGLVTRDGFTRRATVLLKDPRAVVVLADVDRFKQINDTHGHAAGDALLKATADRLTHHVGRSGVAGRLGGDEFAAVVIDDHGTVGDLLPVLHGVLARPVEGQDPAVRTTVSLGWVRAADFPDDDLSGLLRRADEAMYAAKQARTGMRRAGLGRLFATVTGRRSGRMGARTAPSVVGVAA
ncbi:MULTISPECIES: GGDEF domain-containing protein [unclassified Streptomyces]|uniref:GGDEF domain-containing protein n=1 Tax=unclassified Streptomyces TaxID=2593676 RepID=UPI001162C959|nr:MULTISPECIES: GGDEF domain-containing protein [unclassified Streptomyces]NMI60987.1 GGDEF domain-containing protein [Streptomyces sp. RLA2-12]QDN60078.1 GGDEF domain-containing protein [Streptomyces sp. S1D4-20]QDN70158.1 GGDEF domain-containing protein [Streptomyces sp. S1D4-14]QDO52611.1 GGDEF domain-containing protein [Streptomyces sp. RLB3-5]QDO62854.1 GGDEF domain-containing protein [Streptomyces sp. RLB1-8]